MKGILLKDWYLLWRQGKFMFLLALVYLILSAAGENQFFGGFAILFLSMLPMTTLGLDERNRWDRYAVTLPVTRRQLVLEKYLLALIGLFIGCFLYLLFSLTGAAVRQHPFDLGGALLILIPMVSGSLLFSALHFPITFQLGVEKARLWFMLIIALVAAVIGGLVGWISSAQQELSSLNLGWMVWLLPASALLFALSAILSVRIYEAREL